MQGPSVRRNLIIGWRQLRMTIELVSMGKLVCVGMAGHK
jgi:hypothetical protein